MRCPRCQHENPVDAAFCDECGARLEAACAACGEGNRPGAKFCRKCGEPLLRSDTPAPGVARRGAPRAHTPSHLAEKILASKSALEGERKQVTVLFADLKGSMELLLGRLDEARSLAVRAIESCPWHPGYMAHALHLLGDTATHPDRFDAETGETHYRKALALAEPRGMRPLVAHCHLGLGKLCRRTGKPEQAREHLTTATTMYREMDMRFWMEQVETTLRGT